MKDTYTLAELLAELDLARSSYIYHYARLKGPDKFANARIAIADFWLRKPSGVLNQLVISCSFCDV